MTKLTMSLDPEKFEALQKDVSEIKTALLGNERLGIDGMVSDVRDLKKWKSTMRLRIAFFAGGAATIWEGLKFAGEYIVNSNHK